jgi:hypothetical protein
MSETAQLWVWGTVISILTVVISAIAAALWAHVGHCKDVSAAVARIDANVAIALKRLDSLGERSHDHNESILIQDGEISEIMRKLDMDRIPRKRRRRE